MQSTSCKMLGWMKHKLVSRLLARNSNNLRYPNDTSKNELRRLLMQVKEENEIVCLKLNIQKTNKERQTLNDTMDQLDLIDIYRTFHPKTINFTFFSSAHGTFSRLDHILGHKSSLGKFKKIKSFQSSFLTTVQ